MDDSYDGILYEHLDPYARESATAIPVESEAGLNLSGQ
jgi:hypothetical protein